MNEEQQRKQKRLKAMVIAIALFVVLAFSVMVIADYLDSKVKNQKTYASVPDLPLDGIDPKEIWVDQIRTENEAVQERVDFIQEMFERRTKEEGERDSSNQNEINALRTEIENLKSELMRNETTTPSFSDHSRGELKQVSNSYQQENLDLYSVDPFISVPFSNIQEFVAPLSSITCQEPTNLHHVDRSIPAGTTVKAILLSSVDMPCGVRGSTDPLPVKLRMIADGRLPHEVRARLKSGIVTASVYGDLSSERVYFRLEKLIQVRADGHYIETQVAGYVSGEDGKYGLRGVVVDKSSQLIENALMSGFLSGASGFFEAAAMTKLCPYNGCYPEEGSNINWKQSAGQLAIAGTSGGVTNALDALTDYFVKRAEQLRPVIQITPGRIIDITFSESADLGDLHTHERVRNGGKRGGEYETS
jgi:conjugal transfer pilus assembly protein TraB